MTDRELSIKIKESDHKAFHEIFRRYHEALYHFIYYKVRNVQISEDLTQDTFIKLWEMRHTINESMSLKSFLYTIANNHTLNYIRHQKVIYRFAKISREKDQAFSDSPDSHLERDESLSEIHSAIDSLPDKARTIFLMSRVDNLSYKEIATRLDISIKTVESHIGRSLKKLRTILVKE